jgi:hypothetical protein
MLAGGWLVAPGSGGSSESAPHRRELLMSDSQQGCKPEG